MSSVNNDMKKWLLIGGSVLVVKGLLVSNTLQQSVKYELRG
jgi:hypothetical protein